jgi:hypothetical protein
MKRKTVVVISTVIVALVLSLIPGGAIAGGVSAQEKSPTIVLLAPAGVTIGVGDTVDIEVHVEGVSGFYGVQFALRFNPAILDGVSVVEGTAFTSLPAGGYTVAQKDFAGDRARFAASLVGQPPLGGDLHLATIRFRGRDAGNSPLTWANLILANNGGGSIPYISRTGNVVVADRINIVGYAFMQGRTNHAGIDVEVSGPIVTDATTAADGRYVLTDVRSGRYEFLFEHDMYLATRLRNCDTGAGTEFRPPSVTLVAGDLNRDQNIDIMDLTRCAGVFGSADPGADINGDGVVNLFDLVLIGINFGRIGPVVLTCP